MTSLTSLAFFCVVVVNVALLAIPAYAAVRLIKCEGTGLNSALQLLPAKSFFFKFDDISKNVIWAVGDGITKITIDNSMTTDNTLVFYAETNYDPKSMPEKLRYSFVVNRDTGDASIYFTHFDRSGAPVPPEGSYTTVCRLAERIF
jgi:hypothetical protein